MVKIDFGRMLPSKEELAKLHKQRYEDNRKTPENMSFWLPKLVEATNDSVLLLPDTHVIELSCRWWDWLTSDNYTEEKVTEFHNGLVDLIGDFHEGEKLFLKTGVFSNKFEFSNAVCDEDRSNLGRQFLDMYYTSMIYGADSTAELVVRKYIESKEDVPTIYDGMPLHTEFRVFYDFDKKEVIGIANYWHPDEMKEKYLNEDFPIYDSFKDILVEKYEENKEFVVEQ